MDGEKSPEAVPELAPAAPVSGVPDAAPAGGTQMASAIGNSAFSALVGGGTSVDVPTPPPPSATDLSLARRLADDVQRRSTPAAAVGVSRFKWPWESDEKVAEPAAAGVGAAAAEAAKAAAEKAKKEMEAQKAKLEKEIAAMDAAETIIIMSAGTTINSAKSAVASPSVNAAMVAGQLKGIGPALKGLDLEPAMKEFATGAIMDDLRVAVATLDSLDEPKQTTIDDAKGAIDATIPEIDAAVTEGQVEVAGPPDASGKSETKPKLDAGKIGALNGAKMQLENMHKSLEKTMSPEDLANASHFLSTTEVSLHTLMQGAHPDVRESIDRAYRGTDHAAIYLRALGHDKKENLKVVSNALDTATEHITFLTQQMKMMKEDKDKQLKKLAGGAAEGEEAPK